MYIYGGLIVAFCAVFVNAQTTHHYILPIKSNDCQTNADCLSSQCCVHSVLHGQFCHPYQNASQSCHLPGHHTVLHHCGCAPGLTCEQIHLDPNHQLTGVQAAILQAEQALVKGGLGLCAQSSST